MIDTSLVGTIGVIESEINDVKLLNTNVWTFMHPLLEKYKTLTAIECHATGKSYTFKDIIEASLRWAKEIQKYFQNGTSRNVGILCPNVPEYPILSLGTMASGATLCPMRHDYTNNIVLHMLRQTQPIVLVIDSSVYDTLKDVIKEFENMKVFVRNSEIKRPGVADLFEVLFSDGEMLDFETAKEIDPELPACIIFSSGTTGNPKGILMKHKNLINGLCCQLHENFFAVRAATDSFQDTMVGNMPFSHGFGTGYYFLAAFSRGCKIIVFEIGHDAQKIVQFLKEFQPRIVALRASVIAHLAQMEEDLLKEAFASVDVVGNIGSSSSGPDVSTLKAKSGKNFFLQDMYGTSEFGLAIATPLGCPRLGVAGKLGPMVKACILSHIDGKPITKPNEHGELFIKGVGMMTEYVNNPKETKNVLTENNWYRTGDIAFFDQDYFFTIKERVKDMITLDGNLIYPSEIESILKLHEAVWDAGVIGTPDLRINESGKEVPRAFVIRKTNVSEEEIFQFVKMNAAPYLWLHGGIVFVEDLPRNALGKLQRNLLREISFTVNASH